MRRLTLLLAGALVAGLSPSALSATDATLTIRGRGTGWTDLVLPATTVEDARARFSGGGRYVGWWLVRIGEQPSGTSSQVGGVHFVGDPASDGGPSVPLGMRDGRLPAGRYRLYLATDADAEAVVRVPVRGLSRSIQVVPSRRTTSGSGTTAFTVGPAGVVHQSLRHPLRLPPGTLAIASTLALSAPGTTVRRITSCVAPAEHDCSGPTTTTGQTVALLEEHGIRFTALYFPGSAPTGGAESIHGLTAAPGSSRAYGSYFWLATVR